MRVRHKKRCLKGIFRIVPVVQDRLTRPQDHRAMPLDECGKAQFGHITVAPDEPLQKLPVGQISDSARLEDRLNMPENRVLAPLHANTPMAPLSSPALALTKDNVPGERDCSRILLSREKVPRKCIGSFIASFSHLASRTETAGASKG